MQPTNLLRQDPAFQRLADMMAAEAGGVIRTGTRRDIAGKKNSTGWAPHRVGMRAVHHLRVIMPHESVFDVGDDQRDGYGVLTPKPWGRIVDETHALWIALNRMRIPYWGALSAGKGTHTHIFGPPGSNPAAEKPPVARIVIPIAEGPIDKAKLRHEAPPCIRRVVDALARGRNVPHAGRFSAAAYFHHAGVPKSELVDLFQRTPNFDRRETGKHLSSIEDNGYLPFGCAKLGAEGICHDYIKVGRCFKVSNPASFLLKPAERPAGLPHTKDEDVDQGPRDWRHAATGSILEVANSILANITGDPLDELVGIDTDHRLLAPGKDSRLVREFGRRKQVQSKMRKVLWTVGPGPFPALPGERKDAYEQAEARRRIYPTVVPHAVWLPSYDRHDDVAACGPGATCPRGPSCIPGHPKHTGVNPRGCESCPMFRGA